MKVIGLVRVSTTAQRLESQSLKVKEAILRDGYDESDIILIEDTESGSKLSEEERSGLIKLKTIINTEQVSSVYCYEISRISRRPSVIYSIRDLLISKGINLVVLNPYFRLLKEDGKVDESANLFFGIYSSMSENETFLRTERIMRGKERKKSEGKLSVGKPFFGYSVDKDHYVILNKKEAEIVREIFDRYVNKRESSGSIAKDLYLRRAFRDDSTKLLTIQNYVCVVLRERRYCGSDPIYPGIVSKEIFERAEKIRAAGKGKFTRKSRTKQIYPLQGYIYTTDGYLLTIGVTNNRYLKMNDASVKRISLNMTAAHTLTKYVLTKYIEAGAGLSDVETERKESERIIGINTIKISSITDKISELRKENDFIQARIIKRRISESKGDALIDSNIESMQALEDEKVDLEYQISRAKNRLIFLSNSLLNDYEDITINSNEDLRKYVEKYLKKIVAQKIKFSTYRLEYHFLDGKVMVYHFYSTSKGIRLYDKDMKEIAQEEVKKRG